jgi:hypothetical protein
MHQTHRDFLLNYVISRMEKATNEKIQVSETNWAKNTFNIKIRNNYFVRLLHLIDLEEGEVCRKAGAPHEIFHFPIWIKFNPKPNNVNLQKILSFHMFWLFPMFSNHFLETKTNLTALGFLGGLVNQSI